MQRRGKNTKTQNAQSSHYALSAAIAFCAAALFLYFFPDIPPVEPAPPKCEPLASLAPEGAYAGFDEIMDYAPLFIPTRRNASFAPPPPAEPKGWEFGSSEDSFARKNFGAPPYPVNDAEDFNRALAASLRPSMRSFASGYARADIPDAAGGGAGEVAFALVDLSSGETIKSCAVKSDAGAEMFSEAEFKVSLESDGWAMKPLVMRSSGSDAADAKLSELLKPSNLLKGAPPGAYKAVFVP